MTQVLRCGRLSVAVWRLVRLTFGFLLLDHVLASKTFERCPDAVHDDILAINGRGRRVEARAVAYRGMLRRFEQQRLDEYFARRHCHTELCTRPSG